MRTVTTLLVLAALGGSASVAAASPTTDFLEDAIKGDNSEIKLGAMAAKEGASPALRAYGAMLNSDHSKHKAKAVALAKPLGMSIPDGMTAEADVEYAKLKLLSGASFDKEFARYMVQDHKSDIADYQKQVASGDKATLKFAEATLPTLRHHLQVAEKLNS